MVPVYKHVEHMLCQFALDDTEKQRCRDDRDLVIQRLGRPLDLSRQRGQFHGLVKKGDVRCRVGHTR